tara:strand:+ start:324 stop:536 length:213 start_codon:yes stop_codon:yes gene_type:complete
MPIIVKNNDGNLVFSSSSTTSATVIGNLANLEDVNSTGLNDNDIMVYDATTGKFIPVDKDVINDNDGGTF